MMNMQIHSSRRLAVPVVAFLVLVSIFYGVQIEHNMASSIDSYTTSTTSSGIDFKKEEEADTAMMSSTEEAETIAEVQVQPTKNAKQEVLVVQEVPPVQKVVPTLPDIDSATGKSFDGLKFRTFDSNKKMKQAEENDPKPDAKGISLLLSPSFVNKCSKWGVVTTINGPTLAIKHVADLPSWCLVVVADTKTPTDYMEALKGLYKNSTDGEQSVDGLESNVFFFSVEKQKEWEQKPGALGSFVSSTPWKHFCRKNLGYLFAILHGANFIFDFDDDNYVKLDALGKPMNILPLEEEDEMKLLNVTIVANGPTSFNHHPLMHPSFNETSWARGFPLQYIKDKHTQGRVALQKDLPFKSKIEEIGVIQYLADDNPDIDAFHRLSKPLPMTFKFDDDAHPILVPKHSYAPYNGQATVHMRNALWATLLPATVPGRVSDIWRSYFAQCIFADAGLRLVFSPPKISQQRNDHDILGDLNAENDLYMKSGKLIEFLSGWEPEGEGYDSIPARMEQLWIDLYERGYIEIADVTATQMWLGSLVQIGYEFPPLKRRFRNVAVMGQLADSPNFPDMVIFWAQKHREYFQTVIAAGPFSEEQLKELEAHSIQAFASSFQDSSNGPTENLMNALLRFKDSSEIEGMLYAHDDVLLNITDLSQGLYPFPTNSMIENTLQMQKKDSQSYADARIAEDKKES